MATAPPDTDVPSGPMRGIASFRPGVHNGEPFTADTIRHLVANFKRFSDGPTPHYPPYVSLNHDDGLSFGRITDARMELADGRPTLVLDADGVPDPVREWAKGGRLTAPSVEFFDLERDPRTGRVINGFRDADDAVVETPVLRCLTLLGNKPPAVKGLPPLSKATFTHGGRIRRFSEGRVMDRQAMLQALTAAGVDVSAVTDAVPDPVLAAFLEAIQKAATTTTAMSDNKGTDDDTDPTKKMSQTAAVPTLQFTDRTGAKRTGTLAEFAADQQAQLDALRAGNDALQRDQQQRLTEAKRDKVRRFCDDLGAAGQLAPASRPAMEQLLLNCDDVAVRKFADGKADGTALAEQMAALKATLPVVRKFGDKMADPLAGNGQPALSDADKAAMLKATPLGRAALERAKK